MLNVCDIRFSPQQNSYYKVVEFNYVQTMHVGSGIFKKGECSNIYSRQISTSYRVDIGVIIILDIVNIL